MFVCFVSHVCLFAFKKKKKHVPNKSFCFTENNRSKIVLNKEDPGLLKTEFNALFINSSSCLFYDYVFMFVIY